MVIERFKNRTLNLTYTTTYQTLGSEIKSDYWGNINVSHNGRDLKHLSFVTLIIKNTTRSDAQVPLNLDVWVDNSNQFLGHDGHYEAGNAIRHEDNFEKEFNKTLKELDEDLKLREFEGHVTPDDLNRRIRYFLLNRKLSLPVLNRKSSVTINFLIENFEGKTPKLNFSILQKGVKLIPEADEAKIEQVKKNAVGLLCLALYAIGLIWVYKQYHDKHDAITWTVIVGSASYFMAYGFYYLFIWLKKIFTT
ncbi:hypothetical protein BC343_14940 [Mucilaginibacter pedocola]|uniref:Uncharacterized protein n=2 Tax=Mucilaginibacter pedocola TaxID=1792845 RepID=A0A1S9P8U7_9SPHI|nr:hypothetical protein BC343_14940 [Mucilaginibacter pedocola]